MTRRKLQIFSWKTLLGWLTVPHQSSRADLRAPRLPPVRRSQQILNIKRGTFGFRRFVAQHRFLYPPCGQKLRQWKGKISQIWIRRCKFPRARLVCCRECRLVPRRSAWAQTSRLRCLRSRYKALAPPELLSQRLCLEEPETLYLGQSLVL